MNKIKVGVIFGGMSTEHDVSIVSGTSVAKKLDRNKSQDVSKKMKSGMESSIKLGRIRTNTFIYGFQLVQQKNNESSHLVPIPEEAEVIKLIYKLYTEDKLGSRQIVNKLSDMGITTRTKTTKKGKIIGGIPLMFLLLNEYYKMKNIVVISILRKGGKQAKFLITYHLNEYMVIKSEKVNI